MAKQNVTLVERHLEKFLIGAAGAVVVAIVVLYVIQSPNAVEVGGRKLGPDQFYAEMRSRAEQTRSNMQQAGLDGGSDASIIVPDINAQRSPYDYLNLAKEFMVAFVPPAPDVPDIAAEDRPDSVRLAKVLPPRPLVATTGRSFSRLPDPIVVRPGDTGGGEAQPLPAITQEYHWVALFSAVHRKEQRDEFERVRYAPDRQKLLVAAVEAERQMLLPSGEWGSAELVAGYAPRVVPVRETVTLHPQDDGSYAILDADRQYIQSYMGLLDSTAGQEEILRPRFQDFLAGSFFTWQAPKELPGLTLKLTDYGVLLPPEDEGPAPRRQAEPAPPPRAPSVTRRSTGRLDRGPEGGGRPSAPRGPAAPPPVDASAARTARMEIVRLTQAAEEAITKQEFLEARDLLEQIIHSSDANPNQIKDAESRLRAIQQDVDRAERERVRAELARSGTPDLDVGEDVDPLWLTDLRVTPGKTYRYRLRLLVFNQYVGMANRLENTDDASKVVIAGEWSEWSDAIQVQPVRHLFVTRVSDANTATVEIREWSRGEWKMGFSDRKVGDPAAFTVGGNGFSYGAVVAGVDDRHTYQERSVSRDGTITYRERPSAAVVLLTADGDVAEHVAARDTVLKRDLLRQIQDEQKLRERLGDEQPGGLRPGPDPGLGGPGRPGGPVAPRGGFPRGAGPESPEGGRL